MVSLAFRPVAAPFFAAALVLVLETAAFLPTVALAAVRFGRLRLHVGGRAASPTRRRPFLALVLVATVALLAAVFVTAALLALLVRSLPAAVLLVLALFVLTGRSLAA